MVRSLRSSHTLFNTWSPPTSPPSADPRRSSVYPPAAASSAIHLVLDPFQGPSPGAQRTSTVSDHHPCVESLSLSPRSSISRSRSSHSHSHERKAARHHHHQHTGGTASSSAAAAEEGGLGLHSPTGSAHYLFPSLASTPSALSGLSGRESIATTSTLTALTGHTACTAYTAIEEHSCVRSALVPSSTAQTLRALVDAVSPRSFARSASRGVEPPERLRDRDRRPLVVLGPAKRVPSASRLGLELESKPDPNPKTRASMRSLRRQPSMADLSNLSNGGGSSLGRSKGLAVQVGREKDPTQGVLGEVTNWSLGQAVSGPNSKTPYARSELISPRTIVPPSTTVWTAGSSPRPSAAKRRSYTLSGGAPRPPTPPRPSPTLPDVDFGDPLSVSVVIPSPSFSHLDYSTAGSTTSSPHAHAHARTPTFSRRASQHALAVLAPSYGGVAMARGQTRAGLGAWDSARKIARDDAERRLGAQPSPALALGFLDRPATAEVAPKSKNSKTSLRRSTSSKQPHRAEQPRARSQSFSARSCKHSHSPAPAPPSPAPLDHALGSFADEVNIDLGGPYSIPHNNTSPGVRGHTALTSEISILASSFDVSLQQRPRAESTYSLPSSLEAEAIDLTETRPLPPPTSADLPRRSTSLWRLRDDYDDEDGEREREKPAMRTAKTMQPGELRKAYSAAAPSSALRAPSRSPKAEANARLAQRLSITPSASQPQRPAQAQAQVSPAVPGCRSSFMTASASTSTSTTTARRRGRGLGTFCSPPQAHPPSPIYPNHPSQTHTPMSRAASTPLASATSSLRRVFSKSTLSRSLSQVFDRSSPRSTQSTPKVSVSSPLENPALRMQSHRPADEGDGDRDVEHKWREGILKEAVNLSYSRTLTLHSVQEASEEPAAYGVRLSPEKRRPPIPHVLLQAAEVEEKRWTAPYTAQPALGRSHYLKAKDVRRISTRDVSAVDMMPGLAVSVNGASSTFSPPAAAIETAPTPPPRSPMRGTKSPLRTRKSPTPPRLSPRRGAMQTSTTSGDGDGSGSLYLADDSEDHSPSFLSTDPASLPTHKQQHKQSRSRSPLQSLRSSLSLRVPGSTLSTPPSGVGLGVGQGVSSTTPRLVLDELSLRAGMGSEGREDKLHRVREWTYAVEAKGDEARFERGVRRFLVEEKARLARIGRQHSPGA